MELEINEWALKYVEVLRNAIYKNEVNFHINIVSLFAWNILRAKWDLHEQD
jgi:hypothetical protein